MNEKILALGLAEQLGVFILGIEKEASNYFFGPQSPSVSLSHCVRMYELADPSDPRRVGFTWHPDPMFTSEVPMTFSADKVLCVRELSETEEMAIKYKAFLTEFRLRRSGLVSGISSVDHQKKILSEGI